LELMRIFNTYYPPGSKAHDILLRHSHKVSEKACHIAETLGGSRVDLKFVREAAFLHDIGICATHAPELGCYGHLPYLAHGYKGRELLEAEGYPRHALVCERHIGVGLTAREISRDNLPLPVRNMVPKSLEEEIVAYADLFFSKNPLENDEERSVAAVRQSLERFGRDKVIVFDQWHRYFSTGVLG